MTDPIVILAEKLLKELNRDGFNPYLNKELNDLIKTYSPTPEQRAKDLESRVSALEIKVQGIYDLMKVKV